MTEEEFYAMKAVIQIAMRSREYKFNAIMKDAETGLAYSMIDIIDILFEYIQTNFDVEVLGNDGKNSLKS